MTSPATGLAETCNSSAMLGRQPEGLEDANVAFTTSKTLTTVMYHLRFGDQFLGFSMSFGAKSRCPSLFRWMASPALMPLVRYGFATGRDKILSSCSMCSVIQRSRVACSKKEKKGNLRSSFVTYKE